MRRCSHNNSLLIYEPIGLFISLINVINANLTLIDLPLNVFISSTGQTSYNLEPLTEVKLVRFNNSDNSINNSALELYQLDLIFPGSHDWENDSLSNINIIFKFKEQNRNFENIIYSPTLLENYTKTLSRNNYYHDPLYLFLMLSNGLLFIPYNNSSPLGTAIVKNVMVGELPGKCIRKVKRIQKTVLFLSQEVSSFQDLVCTQLKMSY